MKARIVRLLAALALATALVSALMAQPASATFPGKNGLVLISDSTYQIATINSNGTGLNTITNFGTFAEAPQSSPDGKWIVFDGADGANVDLYKIHPDGTHLTQLTFDAGGDWSPSFSADGKLIVWSHYSAGGEIWVMHSDGTHAHRLGTTATGQFARFSPSGNKIAYSSSVDSDIHVMNADGTHDHALTNFGINKYPDWSPDGKKIGFTSNATGSNQVWIMNADGTHDHAVTTTGAYYYSPVFSPNGKKMMYQAETGGQIFIANVDGSNPQPLYVSQGCCEGWQPK